MPNTKAFGELTIGHGMHAKQEMNTAAKAYFAPFAKQH